MRFFSKKSEYQIVNFYVITDSATFNDKIWVDQLYVIISALDLRIQFSEFDFNYGSKRIKTVKRAKEFINSSPDVTSLYAAIKNDTKGLLVYMNNLLNEINPIGKGFIQYLIATKTDVIKIEEILDIMKIESISYGYMTNLDERYSFILEKKPNRKIFGGRVNTNSVDNSWPKHNHLVNEGYLRNIYQYNLINSSHIDNPILGDIIKRYGILSQWGKQTFIWKLSNHEFPLVEQELIRTPFLIANEKNHSIFLESIK